MDNFVVGNMIWNGGLVTVAAYLFKRWMDRTDASITSNRAEAKKENQEKHDDLKAKIQDNRDFYIDTYKDLKQDIKVVTDLQKIANGRTYNLEKNIYELELTVGLLEKDVSSQCRRKANG